MSRMADLFCGAGGTSTGAMQAFAASDEVNMPTLFDLEAVS